MSRTRERDRRIEGERETGRGTNQDNERGRKGERQTEKEKRLIGAGAFWPQDEEEYGVTVRKCTME